MRLRSAISALAFLSGACAGADRPATDLAEPTVTICDLLERPAAHSGLEVRLTGRVVTDFVHSSGIGDSSCPARYLPFGQDRPDIIGGQQFFEAVREARALPNATVIFTARGKLRYSEPGSQNGTAFDVDEFLDIRIVDGATVREIPVRPHERSTQSVSPYRSARISSLKLRDLPVAGGSLASPTRCDQTVGVSQN